MKGFPPHLNTKHDYQYIHDHFPNAKWRPHWQTLLDTKDTWLMTRRLETDEAGHTDATHKVIEIEAAKGATERHQYEFKQDPNALIFRIGFTVAKVKATLAAADKTQSP